MENFSTSWLRLILGDILLLAQRSKRREAQVDKNLSVKPGGPNIFSIQSITPGNKVLLFYKTNSKRRSTQPANQHKRKKERNQKINHL
jgi:hypothetical protein